jgi:acyl-CoA thioesterase FadM
MHDEASLLDLAVRPNDLDSLAHVNNAVSLEYLEAGRWAWMDQYGLNRIGRIVPVVTRIQVDYRREIRPQRLKVRTTLQQAARTGPDIDATYKVRFVQEILINDCTDTAVSAQVDVAFIDGETRSLASLQEFLAGARRPRVEAAPTC